MFLFLFCTATGCPNPPIPVNAYIEREGNNAVIKCNYSDDTWYVSCQRGTWTGQTGECSQGNEIQ